MRHLRLRSIVAACLVVSTCLPQAPGAADSRAADDPSAPRRPEQEGRPFLREEGKVVLPGGGTASERMRAVVEGPNALVVSGGSSLGVYEAGVLYYLTLAQAGAAQRFSVVSGTSAGAINAFMAAMATCQAPNPDPRASPFWLWTEVDWSALFDRRQRDRNACEHLDGVLTRAPLRAAVRRIVEGWGGAAWQACDVRFGAAVTYLDPLMLQLADTASVRVARLTERFAIRMQSLDGGPPVLTAFRGTHGEFPALGRRPESSPAGADSPVREPADVMELLLASSGVPGAFNPIPLQVIYDDGAPPRQECMIDGGALDNVPLSTAIRLMNGIEEERGGARRPAYVYVDADNFAPTGVPVEPRGRGARKPTPSGQVADLGALLGNLVTGARQAELARTITENEDIRRSLQLPQRKHFITGQMLGAFGAFFDQSFREYDFFAGIADAEDSLATLNREASKERKGAPGARIALPEVRAEEYPCFRAVWAARDRGAVFAALRGDACRYLRAPTDDQSPGARTRRDLWRLLALIGPGDMDFVESAAARTFLDRLAGAEGPPGADWEPGYEYVTLRYGGRPAGPKLGLPAVREQLQDLSDRAADRIRRGEGLAGGFYRPLIATAGSELANAALAYRRIPWSLSAGLYGRGGELALARMLGLASGPYFGLDAVGGVQLADYAFDRRSMPGYMDFRAFAGPRAELRPIPPVQLLVGPNVVGQAGLSRRHRTLWRLGWSVRGDVQVLQRLYLGVAYTRWFDDADRWRSEDISLAVGIRMWLRGKP